MSDEDKLQILRLRIDALDEKIQGLINERAVQALEVARVKHASGIEANYYRPEREAEILGKVAARNQGPLANAEIVRLFREIMSVCRALEQPLKIGCLGPDGTFTQAAALKHFGHSVQTLPLMTIDLTGEDLRRDRIAHSSSPARPGGVRTRRQAYLRASASPGSVPPMARR